MKRVVVRYIYVTRKTLVILGYGAPCMLPLWSTTTWWKTRKAIALRLGFESQCVVKLAIVCRTLWPARQRDLAYRWLLYIAYIYMRLSRKILQQRHLPLLRWLCLYTPRSGIQSTKGWVVSVTVSLLSPMSATRKKSLRVGLESVGCIEFGWILGILGFFNRDGFIWDGLNPVTP